MNWESLRRRVDRTHGTLDGGALTRRYLSDLRGVFADASAYERALARGNPLIYTVSAVEAEPEPGALSYGVGVLMPGRVGREYHLTKGHCHGWRPAAEVYVGLRGQGRMLLEHEITGTSALLSLCENEIVYVPGHTAHRTINVGTEPLVYLGVYPALAGHDYGAIAQRNFRDIVIDQDGRPVRLDRATYRPADGAFAAANLS